MAKSKESQVTYVPDLAPRKKTAYRPALGRSSDVWASLKDMEALDREHFVVLHMDVRNRVIERETVAIGCLTGVDVHPRETFRRACVLGSARLILAHNHPSGDPSPSNADIELTDRLRKCGELLGIKILDHVIIGNEGFVSLAERNWK